MKITLAKVRDQARRHTAAKRDVTAEVVLDEADKKKSAWQIYKNQAKKSFLDTDTWNVKKAAKGAKEGLADTKETVSTSPLGLAYHSVKASRAEKKKIRQFETKNTFQAHVVFFY